MSGHSGISNLIGMRGRKKGGLPPVASGTYSDPSILPARAAAFLKHLAMRNYSQGSIDAHRWAFTVIVEAGLGIQRLGGESVTEGVVFGSLLRHWRGFVAEGVIFIMRDGEAEGIKVLADVAVAIERRVVVGLHRADMFGDGE